MVASAAIKRFSTQIGRHVRSGVLPPSLEDIALSFVRSSPRSDISAVGALAALSALPGAGVAAGCAGTASSSPGDVSSTPSSSSSSCYGGSLNVMGGGSCLSSNGLSAPTTTPFGNRRLMFTSAGRPMGPPPPCSTSTTLPRGREDDDLLLFRGFSTSSSSSSSVSSSSSSPPLGIDGDEVRASPWPSLEDTLDAALDGSGSGEEDLGSIPRSSIRPFRSSDVATAAGGGGVGRLGEGEMNLLHQHRQEHQKPVSEMTLEDLHQHMSALLGPGRYEEAISLFKDWTISADADGQHHRPDLMAYNMLLLAYNRSASNTEKLLAVLEDMRKSGVEANLLTYNILLRAAFRVRDSNLAESIIRRLEDPASKVQPDGDSYNFVVTICAMDKRVPPALQYMQSMLRRGFVPSKTTYSEVLTACARTRRTRDAVAVMNELQTQMLEPLPVVLGELLTAGAERDDAECSLMALQKLGRRRLGIDQGGLLMALNAAARTGHTDLAEAAWAYLRECLGAELPHPACYLARVHAYATKGDFESAFRAVQELETAYASSEEYGDARGRGGGGMAAPGRSNNAAMSATSSAAAALAHELLSPFSSLKPLVVACSRGLGVLDTAYYKLAAMHESGEIVSLAAINCIIAGCSNVHDMDRAFQTFEEISRTFGMAPNVHTYNALIDGCAKTKQIAMAIQMFKRIEANGLAFDEQSFQFLIDAYVIDGNAPGSVEALESMMAAGFTPSRPTLVRVLRRCQRTGYAQGGDRVKRLFIQYGYRAATSGDRRRQSIWNAANAGRDDPIGAGEREGEGGGMIHEEVL
ncbi:hypothetical protein CBR_g55790 [Chara braunii]|uniref:Pentacotripeptide-repeat region of PRORP domain-containing protein n=1 Tax=Chara braunii TaxID=69332 RepID=A0A388MD79_CHABU|nr:hypothetical protein CBR_g55790 [Chara braunii]|eukprot:GBG92517.1 hypothetical protein CBR_g55790 [Chara braunii]